MTTPIIHADGLVKHFRLSQGVSWWKKQRVVHAVDGLSFSINQGQTFGLIGESGCGKTTLSKLLLSLYRPDSGTLLIDQHDLSKLSGAEEKVFRKKVQAVFQDPYGAINPRQRVWKFVTEPLEQHIKATSRELRESAAELLTQVGLSASSTNLYPHAFSGGMRQRLAIARALSVQPKILILDEPVSALDVSIRAQVLNLLKDLQDKLGMTYIFVGHDLAVVNFMSDVVGVMYLGKLVEVGPTSEVLRAPRHPYTQGLISTALAKAVRQADEGLPPITGEVMSAIDPPAGCRFRSRCKFAQDECTRKMPEPTWVSQEHWVACHRSSESLGY
jgi:oligopeptide/dipeptide ABC transporter ATP-binding protein